MTFYKIQSGRCFRQVLAVFLALTFMTSAHPVFADDLAVADRWIRFEEKKLEAKVIRADHLVENTAAMQARIERELANLDQLIHQLRDDFGRSVETEKRSVQDQMRILERQRETLGRGLRESFIKDLQQEEKRLQERMESLERKKQSFEAELEVKRQQELNRVEVLRNQKTQMEAELTALKKEIDADTAALQQKVKEAAAEKEKWLTWQGAKKAEERRGDAEITDIRISGYPDTRDSSVGANGRSPSSSAVIPEGPTGLSGTRNQQSEVMDPRFSATKPGGPVLRTDGPDALFGGRGDDNMEVQPAIPSLSEMIPPSERAQERIHVGRARGRDLLEGGDLDLKASESEYYAEVGDILEVEVWRVPDLSRTVSVRPDGRLPLPLIGDLHVVGRSLTEINAALTERYSEYVIQPQVSISVRGFGGRKFVILGEINGPGVYRFQQQVSLIEAVALAGGFTDTAKSGQVAIIRGDIRRAPQVKVITANMQNLLRRGMLSENLWVQPNDIIYVGKDFLGDYNQLVDEFIEPTISNLIDFFVLRSAIRTAQQKGP